MIIFQSLSARNFLSIGNVTQTIKFSGSGLTLILGENLDLGGGSSRNGVGKSTIVNALCYALYGSPLVNIKKENLINHTNQKGMFVSLNYSVNDNHYRIERGRKPNFLRYYVNDGLVNSPDSDESAGESKWTQQEIERVISGLSHTLFKHIIALHTKMIPFLSLREKDQREIIEELLGITQLSNKADQLKDQIKQIRDEIRDEEIRIKTLIDSNDKIQRHINDLKFKSSIWDREHSKKIEKLLLSVNVFEKIDIENEISAHKNYEIWQSLTTERDHLQVQLIKTDKSIQRANDEQDRIKRQLLSLQENSCPTCGNQLHTAQHEEIMLTITSKDTELSNEINCLYVELNSIANTLENKLNLLSQMGEQSQRAYSTLEQALNHRHILDKLHNDISREQAVENVYFEQIANLSTSGLQEVSYDYLNQLTSLKDHQDFLWKLLTSKESFIRKKIIDQNLSYLNRKLNNYLSQLQLPHEVIFQNDLSVEITNFGKQYDFEQLSNGEANRLILALAWAFRDIWENMNSPINLLMIDELIDSGMDSQGTDAGIDLLKSMVIQKNKNIFLISHKDGLESKVDNVLLVQKENNYTSFSDVLMDS